MRAGSGEIAGHEPGKEQDRKFTGGCKKGVGNRIPKVVESGRNKNIFCNIAPSNIIFAMEKGRRHHEMGRTRNEQNQD